MMRMAEGFAAVLVLAALRGREHEAPVLDRAGAISTCQCASPVCLVKAEGMASMMAPGFGQRAVERRKAQVVADRQAEPAPRQVGGHRDLAGAVVARFAIALAAG